MDRREDKALWSEIGTFVLDTYNPDGLILISILDTFINKKYDLFIYLFIILWSYAV